MSREARDAQIAVEQMSAEMNVLVEQLTKTGNPDLAARTMHARMRMAEAATLLTLAAGGAHSMHPNVKELHLSIVTADRMARVLIDGDVDLEGLSVEQIDAITAKLTLAENAYEQFRVCSTLALMHLSDAIKAYEQAHGLARREPTEGTPA